MKKGTILKHALYFAPLTLEVLNDSRLKLPDRVLLSLIIQLSSKEGKGKGYCFANNRHFADNLNCSLSTVSKSINKLYELGYIVKNVPDPDLGGRRYRRYIRSDLIYNAPSSNNKNRLANTTTQPTEKSIHSIITNNKVNNSYISTENERELVQNKMNICFRKFTFYISCKKIYSNKYSVDWNHNNILNLISLCNRLNQYFEFKNGKIQDIHYKLLLKNLKTFLSCKPKFFTDCLPSTFLKFFDKVISDEKFRDSFEDTLEGKINIGFIH